VKNKHTALSFIAIITMFAIVFSSCRKINESTELGGGLIPPVDNINTFDTSLTVQAFQNFFGSGNDSQYLAKNELYYLGKITNGDQFFGQTDARLFLELKPPFYKYSFANRTLDSLSIDSVVLVLDYVESYGDTNTAQTVNVYELDQSNGNKFRSDSSYLIRENRLTYSNLLGSKTFFPRNLKDTVKAYQDTTVNQLRIRLNPNFGTRLLSYDSTGNGAYGSDSLFKDKFKGFALQSMGSGNAVMGFDLTGVNTKLAIYYRYQKRVISTVPQEDTTVSYFTFSGNSAAANYIQRDYTGSAALGALLNGNTPDPIVYIQGSPGTFANIRIPGLSTLSNRVIHRAELIAEQLYDISDSTFRRPDFLYLDASDPLITTNKKFRSIPFDLVFDSPEFGQPNNLGVFGVAPVTTTDVAGNKVSVWKFNISRYVQHIFTQTRPLYDLRLYAPFIVNNKYEYTTKEATSTSIFQLNPTIVKGRVRLIGNNGTNDNNPRRMRLRIIYSKL
jgi:hypothetical protein